MFLGRIPNQHERLAQLLAKYHHEIRNGTFKPYVYPLGSVGVFIVILYFMIPHHKRPWLKRARYVVWALNLLFSLYIVFNFRAAVAPADYGVGLMTWWFVLWSTAVMITQDGQADFARIERSEGATKTVLVKKLNGHAVQVKEDKLCHTYQWQAFPSESMAERLDWVLDLLSNFRGMSWNWRIAALPNPPKDVQDDLKENTKHLSVHVPHYRPAVPHLSREDILHNARKWFMIGYVILDFLRTIVIHDPYYRGLGTEHQIWYLPLPLIESPAFHQAYRLLIGLGAVYWALATIFCLAPLFFCGVLGSDLIGVRGEPWVYPREWGSFTSVLDRGLSGWWGIWWHQTFRFAFEAPSMRLIKALGVDKRSKGGRALQLFVAFALSGSLHASGSHTSIGDTRPLRGPFLFFFLQPFGILGQAFVARLLNRLGIKRVLPRIFRQTGNFVVVHTWFYFTAPLLINDLAAGGTFLYEPVPFSIFRLIGLGGRYESSLCWTWPWTWFRWHTGEVWWQSGLSI